MAFDNTIVLLYYNTMNWITTNIRFPEDLYMELKMEAARKRQSVAALVRDRLTKTSRPKRAKGAKLLREFEKLARENAKRLKGVNLTKALIEMRYEQ